MRSRITCFSSPLSVFFFCFQFGADSDWIDDGDDDDRGGEAVICFFFVFV